MSSGEPEMHFTIEEGVVYTPQVQLRVAACRRRANDDFISNAVSALKRNGSIDFDTPVRISIHVGRDAVSWSLTSQRGHCFSASLLRCYTEIFGTETDPPAL